MAEQQTIAPACKGKPLDQHPLIELGTCGHRVPGSIHTYIEFACPDCGITAWKGPISFACGRGIKGVGATPENCLALKWKSERTDWP